MQQVIYVITTLVEYFLIALQLLMFARALLSWLPVGEDTPISNFLFAVTEPVVMPVRMVLERFQWVQNMPIDISFFVAMMLLILIQALLPTVRV